MLSPKIAIAVLLTVLQVAYGQKVNSLTACLVDKTLRVDCRFDNTSKTPLQYEFSLTREKQRHVLNSTMGVPEHAYRSRVNLTISQNYMALFLKDFSQKDEGIYACDLRASGIPNSFTTKNITVYKDKLQTCGVMSLLVQNTSWLLLLLLSVPLLQATNFECL
ncbi:thy-1 membrane glycoprotein [Monodelphis domestica]|uniref:Thy-1 membrane glycoprotein n=1 Tax=Monodelphis domestica TaxID=13616 RepID=F7FAD2_MONDO|nr:thy-1 membrane glycoprotein [Monodelphis domestica]XP_007494703.1 thy-1 membrane glycoprotein [Monodelphis domestica]XP_056650201.1 thy-1 membrane glycoprotein [Monodelphis domestica]